MARRWARIMWNFAAFSVGGNFCGLGWSSEALTILQYIAYRNVFRDSPGFPPYIATRNWKPYAITSCTAAVMLCVMSVRSTSCVPVVSLLNTVPFPIPKMADVVLQPPSTCTDRICLHAWGPIQLYLVDTGLLPFPRFLQSGLRDGSNVVHVNSEMMYEHSDMYVMSGTI